MTIVLKSGSLNLLEPSGPVHEFLYLLQGYISRHGLNKVVMFNRPDYFIRQAYYIFRSAGVAFRVSYTFVLV